MKKFPENIEELKAQFGVLVVGDQDIVVIMCESFLSDEHSEEILKHMKRMFPTNKILILDEGTKVGVMKKEVMWEKNELGGYMTPDPEDPPESIETDSTDEPEIIATKDVE